MNIYKQFFKDNRLEFIHLKSVKYQIARIVKYVDSKNEHFGLNRIKDLDGNKFNAEQKLQLSREKNEFILEWLSDLEEKKFLASVEDTRLIEQTIKRIKERYLTYFSDIFLNEYAEKMFNCFLTHFERNKKVTYSFLYNQFSAKNGKFLIKCSEVDYVKYIKKNHLEDYQNVRGLEDSMSKDREDRFEVATKQCKYDLSKIYSE